MDTASTNQSPLTLRDVQKHIFKAIIIAAITGIGAGVGTGIGVYFRTVDKVDEHTAVISKLTQNVDNITVMVNNLKTQSAVEATAPVNQQKQLDDVKQRMDKLETKIDKIYDLMLSRGK